jgi:hypothetical protein
MPLLRSLLSASLACGASAFSGFPDSQAQALTPDDGRLTQQLQTEKGEGMIMALSDEY